MFVRNWQEYSIFEPSKEMFRSETRFSFQEIDRIKSLEQRIILKNISWQLIDLQKKTVK